MAAGYVEYAATGSWYTLYLTLFSGLAKTKTFQKLNKVSQVRVFNALGVCLAEAGRSAEALATFGRLRALSGKLKDTWGIGQSFINAG